jgi:protein-L-isoaspartate(D-aspartate) O-methyltransferase
MGYENHCARQRPATNSMTDSLTQKVTFAIIFVILVVWCCSANDADDAKASSASYASKREQMVERQIRARGIEERRIIDALLKVERHLFVPPRYAGSAYDDRPLPIGYGQTISNPFVVAYMTQSLEPAKSDKVLEIGTGSGYQAAILAELCNTVYTIEIVPALATRAQELLQRLGYQNIHVKTGDGYEGWSEHAPYDAIIVTCAPTRIPQPLKQQLKEGGRMIIPVGSKYVQDLVFLRKTGGTLKEERVLPVLFVPMVDSTGVKY